MEKLLLVVSTFTLACAGWLAFMEIELRHPGYAERIGIASAIAFICVATILVRLLHSGVRTERSLWAGAVVLIGSGGMEFFHNSHAAHFEGFILVIACVLVLQGVLMLATLGRTRGSGARPLDPMTPAR